MTRRYAISFLLLLSAWGSLIGRAQDLRLVLPIGHTAAVRLAQFSPDGEYIVTVAGNGDYRGIVWDAESGKELHALDGHTDEITSAQFSPNGTTIVTASDDHTAKVWEVATGKELHSLEGHSDWVRSAQFSPDGQTIVTTSDDGTYKNWDAKSGKELQSVASTQSRNCRNPHSAQFSPDGKTMVSIQGHCFDIWDATIEYELTSSVSENKSSWPLHMLGHWGHINSAQFSPDGKTIVTASNDSTAKVWDVTTGKELHALEGHTESVNSAQFSPDGKTIVSASDDNTAKVWDATSGRELYTLGGPLFDVENVQFSPEGKTIVAAGWHRTKNITKLPPLPDDGPVRLAAVKVWSTQSGQEIQTHFLNGCKSGIQRIELSPDGKTFLIIPEFRGRTKIWDITTGQELHTLDGHSTGVNSAEFSPEGNTILLPLEDGTVRFWTSPWGGKLRALKGHSENVSSAQFSPDGKTIVTSSWDASVKLWNRKSQTVERVLSDLEEGVSQVRYSPDGKTIITNAYEGTTLWDADTGEEFARLWVGLSEELGSPQINHHGQFVVETDSDSLEIWSLQPRTLLSRFPIPRPPGLNSIFQPYLTGLELSPDGKQVFIVFDAIDLDPAVVLDATTKQELYWLTDSTVRLAHYSPDGESFVTASWDSTAKIWGATTGKELHTLEGHSEQIFSAQFSPNGHTVVTTSYDNTAKVWDATTGKVLHDLKGHSSVIRTVRFSPNQAKLITIADDHTVKFWNAQSGKLEYSLLFTRDEGWLAWDPEYRYDGSPEAIEQMHFACGLEVIELSQAKGALYVPNLVSRIMSGEDLSRLPGLDDLDLCGRTPIVTPLPSDDRGYLFDIEPRKGGVSTCEVYIDGVRRLNIPASDLQPQDDGHLLLTVSAEQVAEYATAAEAEVTVIARTAGNLTSRGSKTWAAVADPRGNSRGSQPAFHGLFVGINDYKGDGLKLNYAAADARELGQVVEAAAAKMFGEDEVHITTLLSDAATGAVTNPPEKHRLLAELEDIAERSNSRDILFIHLAGHGNVNADGEFVFLTSEASSLQDGDYTGVTMREINDALMGVKASQRILILDACHSGEAVQDLLGDGNMDVAYTARNSVSLEEDIARGRQLERLGDNANMTMLTASASDQAAFELPEIGHGLLTYALLDAIQGHTDILDEGRFLEVKPWIYQAEKTVNERSTGPNRQQAQALTPANYPIGEITADVRDLIQIEEKPVIKRISFEDDNEEFAVEFEDALKLAWNGTGGARGTGSVLLNEQHPNGLTLRGTAFDNGDGTYDVTFLIKRGRETLAQDEARAVTPEEVVQLIEQALLD